MHSGYARGPVCPAHMHAVPGTGAPALRYCVLRDCLAVLRYCLASNGLWLASNGSVMKGMARTIVKRYVDVVPLSFPGNGLSAVPHCYQLRSASLGCLGVPGCTGVPPGGVPDGTPDNIHREAYAGENGGQGQTSENWSMYNWLMPITRSKRTRVLASNGGLCIYCNQLTAIALDHVIPIKRGGRPDAESNLAPACTPCNLEKGNMLVGEWEEYCTDNGLSWPPSWDENEINLNSDKQEVVSLRREMAGLVAALDQKDAEIKELRAELREARKSVVRAGRLEQKLERYLLDGCIAAISAGKRCEDTIYMNNSLRLCLAHFKRTERTGSYLGIQDPEYVDPRTLPEARVANSARAKVQWSNGGTLRERESWSRQRKVRQ